MSKINASQNLKNAKYGSAALLAIIVAAFVALPIAWKVQAVGELKIQYRYGDTASDNKIKPEMKLVNTTASAISLSNIKIRYWFTADDASAPTIYCDFATVGCANLTQNVVSLSTARTNADKYLEIGFTSGAGSIAGAGNQTIKVRLQKATNYSDANDYSFDSTKTDYADWTRITVYRAGALIWGTEPGGGTSTPTPTPTATPTPTPTPGGSIVNVSNASQLATALANAQAGQTIQLADGVYSGRFVASRSGTSSAKITLQGSRNAILNGGSSSSGYGFNLKASYWRLLGFTVTNSQKGIMLDGASNNLIDDVYVHHVGQEAVHFRAFSSNNTIQNSLITDTGLQTPAYGEGVYLGTAQSNWGSISGGNPDTSNNNKVLYNHIGPNVTAEHIDIKEGTTGGTITGNYFDGNGISGDNYADSWVDVKGNNYTLNNNIGQNTTGQSALVDGFQTHVILSGWGKNNVFSSNTANVNASGYGFNIQTSGTGNVVYSNNTVTGAGSGVSNIPLTNP
jgi:hypothetical protein